MEEFLFEENLLESMEIVSFEERSIDEIIRENAHALLDAEMDLEDILTESIEVTMEGTGDNIRAKIKAIWEKVKQYVKKFLDWIRSLFKKGGKTEVKKSNNKETGSNKDENKVPDEPKSTPNQNDKLQLFDAKSAEREITKFVESIQRELSKGHPLSIFKERVDKLKDECFEALNKLWVNGNKKDVIEERNDTVYYYNVNSDFENLISSLQNELGELERAFNDSPEDYVNPEEYKNNLPYAQCTAAYMQQLISHLQKIFQQDRSNRMKVIREDVKANGNRRGA